MLYGMLLDGVGHCVIEQTKKGRNFRLPSGRDLRSICHALEQITSMGHHWSTPFALIGDFLVWDTFDDLEFGDGGWAGKCQQTVICCPDTTGLRRRESH